MKSLLLIAGVTLASGASAASYATDGGCAFGSDPVDWGEINDASVYFDGSHIVGWEWSCDLAADGIASCQDDEAPYTVSFTVQGQGNTVVMISSEGQTYTLTRCP